MNVEIGAEAALFPEKKYINGIAIAVHMLHCTLADLTKTGQTPNVAFLKMISFLVKMARCMCMFTPAFPGFCLCVYQICKQDFCRSSHFDKTF
jgi:hypothetical protein